MIQVQDLAIYTKNIQPSVFQVHIQLRSFGKRTHKKLGLFSVSIFA